MQPQDGTLHADSMARDRVHRGWQGFEGTLSPLRFEQKFSIKLYAVTKLTFQMTIENRMIRTSFTISSRHSEHAISDCLTLYPT